MPKTILLVEDTPDVREMMKCLLEMLGYCVMVAEDGKSGVEKAVTLHPNLIFMDISMPVMDGLTATRIIREKEGDGVPIIALTAFGKQYYEQAIEFGCNDLIPKPIDFDALQAVIERYLSR